MRSILFITLTFYFVSFAAIELEEADVDQMRVIAIESKIEWRGFTDEMKMVTYHKYLC